MRTTSRDAVRGMGWMGWVAIGLMGVWAQPALACVGHGDSRLATLPGMSLFGLPVTLVLPILAAFIERPFVMVAVPSLRTAPGATLSLLMQANLVSAMAAVVVGVPGLVVIGGLDSLAVLAWFTGVALVAAVVEYAYFTRLTGERRVVQLHWLVVGNLLSAGVIAALPLLRGMFGFTTYAHFQLIYPHRDTIALATLLCCAAVYAWAVGFAPAAPNERATEAPRGFEVIAR